jgi:hypothetical protein
MAALVVFGTDFLRFNASSSCLRGVRSAIVRLLHNQILLRDCQV